MNKEFIDKHEAYLLLKQKAETYMLPATKEAYERAAILIDSIKTCDVQPVKHGRWEVRTQKDGTTTGQHNVVYCSECGYVIFTKENSFCARCGARMDDEKV